MRAAPTTTLTSGGLGGTSQLLLEEGGDAEVESKLSGVINMRELHPL